MTGLKIKGGHCIRTPGHEAFVLKDTACVVNPDGLTQGFGYLLFVFCCHS